VTRARVNAFIESYLGEDNRASLLYVPRDMPADSDAAASLAEAVR
jgi:hypothetical protein